MPEEGFESLFNGHDLTGWGFRPTPEDKAAARSWQAADPDAAAWPFVDGARTSTVKRRPTAATPPSTAAWW